MAHAGPERGPDVGGRTFIASDAAHPPPPSEVETCAPTARPGHRAPHLPAMVQGRRISILDLFACDGFTLPIGPGQVPIKVAAAGANRHDLRQRAAGRHADGLAIPGLEVCGTVAALGEGVAGIDPGDRVMALVQGGGYGRCVLANAPLTMPALGRNVIATAGGEDKTAAARGFGAMAFSHSDPDLADKVMAATGGAGISALLDMSAGAHIDQDVRMMAPTGRSPISRAAAGRR